jgi:golgi-specific brefeldin A-resistance guanine nucleotide exchange factor 1
MGSAVQDASTGVQGRELPQWQPSSTTISVARDPVALVITECITVTSAMRKDARWKHSSVAAILGGGSSKPAPLALKPKDGSSGSSNIGKAPEEEGLESRWGLRGKKGKSMQDNPLMAAFTRLRSDLKGCKGSSRF